MENVSVREFSVRAAPIGARPAVAQELSALLRLYTWRTVDASRLFGRDVTLALLGALSVALWVGLDRLDHGPDAELLWKSAYQNGVLAFPVLLSAWVLARLGKPPIEMRQTLLLVLGFLPIFVVSAWIATRLPTTGVLALFVPLSIMGALYLATGMRSLTGKRQPLAVACVLVVALGVFFLSFRHDFSQTFWLEPEQQAEAEAQRDNEQLVYEQLSRVNAAISSLAPDNPANPDVFFVGFAGYGDMKVFADEIGLAAKLVGERYGATARSLRLVNDKRDAMKFPLANSPSLRHTLNALGRHMNVDEDILFLALSSHGTKEGSVQVRSDLGEWRDLDAHDLADMLRESGIRWRVIVVSACYAGTFIEPLRDDHTIILTAAAADRKSFGCNARRHLTYFGEAFYRDALPQAESLRAAFDNARVALEARESRLGMTPSNPQAHFGKAIEQKLEAIEAAVTAARSLP